MNIIVMDISKGLKEPIVRTEEAEGEVEVPKTQEELLCYWLRSIQSKMDHPNHQTTLFFTHKDEIQAADKEVHIEEFKKNVLSIIEKNNLPKVLKENIHVVDSKGGNEEDFRHYRQQLFLVIQKQTMKLAEDDTKSWGAPMPVKWLQLEADIIKARETGSPGYMKLDELKELSQNYDMSDSELESFLLFHHTIGDFVYFPEEGLKDIVITNPQWLIDVLKVLIAPRTFVDLQSPEITSELLTGIVRRSVLEELWKRNVSHVQFIVDLLFKFDLMVPLPPQAQSGDNRFLIPSMLPTKRDQFSSSMTRIYTANYFTKFKHLLYIGAFSRLVAECCKKWAVKEDDNLSYGFASFEVKGLVLTLYLRHGSIIEVSLWCEPSELKENPQSLLTDVAAFVHEKFVACKMDRSNLCKVLCPAWEPGETTHLKTPAVSLIEGDGKLSFQRERRVCLCHGTGIETRVCVCVYVCVRLYLVTVCLSVYLLSPYLSLNLLSSFFLTPLKFEELSLIDKNQRTENTTSSSV